MGRAGAGRALSQPANAGWSRAGGVWFGVGAYRLKSVAKAGRLKPAAAGSGLPHDGGWRDAAIVRVQRQQRHPSGTALACGVLISGPRPQGSDAMALSFYVAHRGATLRGPRRERGERVLAASGFRRYFGAIRGRVVSLQLSVVRGEQCRRGDDLSAGEQGGGISGRQAAALVRLRLARRPPTCFDPRRVVYCLNWPPGIRQQRRRSYWRA
jgi:hypothetical protein